MAIEDTGAAKSIANFFIKLFRGKNMELAPSLTHGLVPPTPGILAIALMFEADLGMRGIVIALLNMVGVLG